MVYGLKMEQQQGTLKPSASFSGIHGSSILLTMGVKAIPLMRKTGPSWTGKVFWNGSPALSGIDDADDDNHPNNQIVRFYLDPREPLSPTSRLFEGIKTNHTHDHRRALFAMCPAEGRPPDIALGYFPLFKEARGIYWTVTMCQRSQVHGY